MQERRNSIANALELRLSCTKLSIWSKTVIYLWLYRADAQYVGGSLSCLTAGDDGGGTATARLRCHQLHNGRTLWDALLLKW